MRYLIKQPTGGGFPPEKVRKKKMNKFVGKLTIGNVWETVGELKETLASYGDDLKIHIVQSTGPAEMHQVERRNVETDEVEIEELMVAPFDFEMESGTVYIPIHEGKILSFVQIAE